MWKSFTIDCIPLCSYSYLIKIYYKLEKLKYIRREWFLRMFAF